MEELKFIDNLQRKNMPKNKLTFMGIGDDCAVLEYNKNEYILWASDMLISGTHFNLGKDNLEGIGHKAIAVNISDITAMGGKAKCVLVSIGIPKNFTINKINKIYKGINKLCNKYGIDVVGGDTNKSHHLVIDVSIIGIAKKENLVLRNGAKKGDVIFVTGPIRNGKKEHLSFLPRTIEAEILIGKYKVNSMIDTSDGLALDLSRICSASKKGALIYEDYLPLPRGLTVEDALYYGESFELLFTMGKKEAVKLIKNKKYNKHFYVIGEITSNGKMHIMDSLKKKRKIEPKGYNHF